MTPYYERDGIQLFHCDCRELLPTLAVDHCITDPPYSEQVHTGARTRTVGARSDKLVNFEEWTTDVVAQVFSGLGKICRRWIVASMDWSHAAFLHANPPAGLRFVRLGAWVKPNSAPQLTGDRPATGWEAVAILHREGKTRWNGGGKRAVWIHNRVDAEFHDTQKPVPLIEEWIGDFTGLNELILDPFAGSGTTGVAAYRMGRRAVLIEQDERHCETAAARLDREISQGRLFQPEPVKETQAALFGDAE